MSKNKTKILVGDSSPKKIIRHFHSNNKTSIVVDFKNVKNKSEEYFCTDNTGDVDQFKIYSEINKFLFSKNRMNKKLKYYVQLLKYFPIQKLTNASNSRILEIHHFLILDMILRFTNI
jgi:hypothetical protein